LQLKKTMDTNHTLCTSIYKAQQWL